MLVRIDDAESALSEAQVLNALTRASPLIEEERQWNMALDSRDCKQLMELLEKHPRLWQKVAAKNRTVLHVAVMQGCVNLVELVLTPFENRNGQEFQKDVTKLLHAKDGKCKANAFQLAAIVGNKVVIKLLDDKCKAKQDDARDKVVIKLLDDKCKAKQDDARDKVVIKLLDNKCKAKQDDAREGSKLNGCNTPKDPCSLVSESMEEDKFFKELPRNELHKALLRQMEGDIDFNFEDQWQKLIINFACKNAHSNIEFLKSIPEIAGRKLYLLIKLFNRVDSQGRTPLHVAVDHCTGVDLSGLQVLLDIIPDECVNARDSAGRTPLLRATVNGMSLDSSNVVKILADDPRTDLNAEWPGGSRATALHLAVLHGHDASAKFVLEAQREDLAKRADVERQMSRRIKVFKDYDCSMWTPLELAAVMGRHSVLVNILQSCKTSRKAICDHRCLHLAAAAGDPQSIQALLMNRSDDLQHFNTNQHYNGYSCLHFAVYFLLPHQPSHSVKPPSHVRPINKAFDRFLAFTDFATVYWLQQELSTAATKGPQKLGTPVTGYGGKQMCTKLLLQAGVDIFPCGNIVNNSLTSIARDSLGGNIVTNSSTSIAKDSLKNDKDAQKVHHDTNITFTSTMPDPGIDAPDDARMWWYDLVAKHMLEAKVSFNAAGNATAVVATLVATASFIGPLSPPLDYSSTVHRVQMSSLPVRVFTASNSVSFYLAIASIMLAIMPSLPMPQEGLREELRRSRRTVAFAISVLLLSILGLLVSFTSSLIAVLPENHYWSYSFYPAFAGGLVCGVVLFLFSLRLLRLVFSRNVRIKNFYHVLGKL